MTETAPKERSRAAIKQARFRERQKLRLLPHAPDDALLAECRKRGLIPADHQPETQGDAR